MDEINSLKYSSSGSKSLSELIDHFKKFYPYSPLEKPSIYGFIKNYTQFVEVLEKINELVGFDEFKISLTHKVKSFVVHYRLHGKPTNREKLHTIIYGSPGSGKTHLGKLLAEFWTVCGCLVPPKEKPVNDPELNQSKNKAIYKPVLSQTNPQNDAKNNTHPSFNAFNSLPYIYNELNNLNECINLLNQIRKKCNVCIKSSDDKITIGNKIQEVKSNIKSSINYKKFILNQKDPEIFNNNINPNPKPIILPSIHASLPVVVPTKSGERGEFPIHIEPKIKVNYAVFTRGDLIAKYAGHTTDRVRKIFEEYEGGAILLDEVYELCTSENDIYGREILTEIINYMTSYPDKLVFIFAGYKNQINDTIMAAQPGLARRFTWKIDVALPSSENLFSILQLQLKNHKLFLSDDIHDYVKDKIHLNFKNFPYFGGDTERLADKIKEIHESNLWDAVHDSNIMDDNLKIMSTTVNMKAFDGAYNEFIDHSNVTQSKNFLPHPQMYS